MSAWAKRYSQGLFIMDTSLFQLIKLSIVHLTGLSKDSLHIYVGLFVFLGATTALRKRLPSFLPVIAVLVVATAGELFDLRDDLQSLGYWRWGASLHDVINTVFWPLILSAIIQRTSLFRSSGN